LLELRSGPTPFKLGVYNTHQSSASFERLAFGWAGNVACIATEKGSSGGSPRSISIVTDGVERINISSNGSISFNQQYAFPTTTGSPGQVLGVGSGSTLAWVNNFAPEQFSQYKKMVSSVPHGLTSAMVGRVLFGSQVFDDASDDSWPTGVLSSVTDAGTLFYATEGTAIDILSSMFDAAYDIEADGRFMFWDFSELKYKRLKPLDSNPRLGPVLMVNFLENSKYNCTVLGLGPNSW
jgi:hypothetical protein